MDRKNFCHFPFFMRYLIMPTSVADVLLPKARKSIINARSFELQGRHISKRFIIFSNLHSFIFSTYRTLI